MSQTHAQLLPLYGPPVIIIMIIILSSSWLLGEMGPKRKWLMKRVYFFFFSFAWGT